MEQRQKRWLIFSGVVAGLVIVAVVAFGAAAAAANNRHAAQELQQAAATPVDAAAAGAPAAVQTALSRKMALKQAYSLFKPMIVLTGDSITEYGQKENGWALSLASTYARRADVVNRGFGGYNSRMALYVLDEFLNSFGGSRIKLATIGFGTNDAAVREGKYGYLHTPVAEYKSNLEAMVSKLKAKGVENILIIVPPPVRGSTWQEKSVVYDAIAGKGKLTADVQMYAVTAADVATAKGIPMVDMYSAIMKVKDWEKVCLEEDGVHLAPMGQKVMYDAVMDVIFKQLPHIKPDVIPVHMPSFDSIDSQSPGKTFDTLYGYEVQTYKSDSPPSVTVRTVTTTLQTQTVTVVPTGPAPTAASSPPPPPPAAPSSPQATPPLAPASTPPPAPQAQAASPLAPSNPAPAPQAAQPPSNPAPPPPSNPAPAPKAAQPPSNPAPAPAPQPPPVNPPPPPPSNPAPAPKAEQPAPAPQAQPAHAPATNPAPAPKAEQPAPQAQPAPAPAANSSPAPSGKSRRH